ncbi:uncharacterized protein LOC126266301 [Aethina tumida]|uniref:uncharacterized protein LOC126266301 n=1 Tax=Aethina tumida TaxID=116153 RepID=UPI00096B1A19|nr:uncharacterized protein LOC126266301 [Aethina tumida]
MHIKLLMLCPLAFVLVFISTCVEGLQRCFVCRSRGELGSCKDPFVYNVTLAEPKSKIGIDTIPCASGWCGKIVESENALKEEYGVATQRVCLQRGPSDSEDRCAQTKWNHKKVLMCFCKGDLCNSSVIFSCNYILILLNILVSFRLIITS